MPPAARIGDMHTCPMVTPGTPPVPHVGGPLELDPNFEPARALRIQIEGAIGSGKQAGSF